MRKRNIVKRLSAIVFAAVLAMAPLSSASASSSYDLPDGTEKGSITVHKYFRDSEPTNPGTGVEITDADELAALGTPADDADMKVGFTLYQVPSTFEMTETTTVAEALAAAISTPVSVQKFTDEDGAIVWDELAVGYYVLVETAPLTGYSKSPDAIIALPYGLDGDEWNYDVHVYPKNVNDKPLIKTVEKDTPYNVGEDVKWEYAAKVDTSKLYKAATDTDSEVYGAYKLTDTYDSRLTYNEDAIIKGYGGATVTLVEGIHYDETHDSDECTIEWKLTTVGIDLLVENKITSLVVEFTTEINETALGTGEGSSEILNGGELEWTNAGESTPENYEIADEDKPAAKLYSLEIEKTNNDGSIFLNGAKFKIAVGLDEAKAGTFLKDEDGEDLIVTTADRVVDSTTYSGWALFGGLAGDEDDDTDYYLVEVEAPTADDGSKYVRPTEPIKVTVEAGTQINTVNIKNYLPGDPDIPDMWNLPLTGGMGTVLFYVIGTVVMLGAVVVFIKSKKTKTVH